MSKQALPQLGFYVNGSTLGDDLTQPHKTGAQDHGAEQEKEQQPYLLEISAAQEHPINYLAQEDHLGDRGASAQYPQDDSATQEDPGMLHLA
jgi:hypothetical protein